MYTAPQAFSFKFLSYKNKVYIIFFIFYNYKRGRQLCMGFRFPCCRNEFRNINNPIICWTAYIDHRFIILCKVLSNERLSRYILWDLVAYRIGSFGWAQLFRDLFLQVYKTFSWWESIYLWILMIKMILEKNSRKRSNFVLHNILQ